MDRPGLVGMAYDDLVAVLAGVDDEQSWSPTGCPGWSVRDLTHHCAADARRALVALHTPVTGQADTDSVGYWRAWGAADDDRDRRFGRMQPGVFDSWPRLAGSWTPSPPARFPSDWTDRDVVLLGTGRARPTSDQADALGVVAEQLPLFS